jgi:hypothetical protein
VLRELAHEPMLAAIPHRFHDPTEIDIAWAGPNFLGRALAAAALRAHLRELLPEAERIVRRATSAFRRTRELTSDVLRGQLDTGRLALAIPGTGVWPIVRVHRTPNTPENALILSSLEMTVRWAATNALRMETWRAVALFGDIATHARELLDLLRGDSDRPGMGELALESIGASRLLPLAKERLAFRQADPGLYGKALALIEMLLRLIDPLAGQPHRANDVVKARIPALLEDLNNSNVANDLFELWIVACIIRAAKVDGYSLQYQVGIRKPFVLLTKGSETEIEIWWQSARPLTETGATLDHERMTNGGEWKPVPLRPDIVLRRRPSGHTLLIECKNKLRKNADSRDVAQTVGYLSHYRDVWRAALAYRSLGSPATDRSRTSFQAIVIIGAPIKRATRVGSFFLGLTDPL